MSTSRADDSSQPLRPVILVTGGAGGIGTSIIRRFADAGWRTASADLINAVGSDAETFRTDVRSPEQCTLVVARTVERFGRLDVLVNAAGVWHEGDTSATSEHDFDRVIDVNLKGTFFMCAAAIPHLRETRGCIVNLSSDAGLQGNSGAAAYCASKGGVSVFTKALALELAPFGVRVNAVCPGDVDSPMLRNQASSFGRGAEQRYYETLLDGYPQRKNARFITTDEVAEFVWFLAQPHAAAITGANLSIDFGLSAGIFPRGT